MSAMDIQFAPGLAELELDDIEPNALNVRLDVSERALRSLADSIRDEGLLHPLVVRRHPRQADKYQLVCGERRWRAFNLLAKKDAQFSRVPVRVMRGSDDAVLAVMHRENTQRNDWTQYEKALFYKQAYESGAFSSLRVTASSLGMGTTTLHRYLKIFDLPRHLVDRFRDERLTLAHMELFVEADPVQYKGLLQGIEKQGWGKQQARAWLQGAPAHAQLNLLDAVTAGGVKVSKRGDRVTISLEAGDKKAALAKLKTLLEGEPD